jgi:hypothetical protein
MTSSCRRGLLNNLRPLIRRLVDDGLVLEESEVLAEGQTELAASATARDYAAEAERVRRDFGERRPRA